MSGGADCGVRRPAGWACVHRRRWTRLPAGCASSRGRDCRTEVTHTPLPDAVANRPYTTRSALLPSTRGLRFDRPQYSSLMTSRNPARAWQRSEVLALCNLLAFSLLRAQQIFAPLQGIAPIGIRNVDRQSAAAFEDKRPRP